MRLIFFIVVAILVLEANVNVVCKAGVMENENAKIYINKLLKKEPENIECILKLANIYLKSGELLQGYKLIARAYKTNSTAVELSNIANILPYALEMTKLVEKSNKNNDKLLWNEVGNNFFDMGVYAESIPAYEKSLLLDAKQQKIGLKLALSYKKSNQTYRAVKQLEILITQNEEDFYAHYYLGKILRYAVSDEENATLHFQRAKEILLFSKENFSHIEYPRFIYDINTELSK